MIDKLNDSVPEYEKQQQAIDKVLKVAEKLVDEDFARIVQENEAKVEYKNCPKTPLEILESHKYTAEFHLPSREGFQTLLISFWAANPYNREDPDVLLKVLHSEKNYAYDNQEIKHDYTIRQTPDGDRVLETSVRDLTQLNRSSEAFERATASGLRNKDIAVLGLAHSINLLDTLHAEASATAEERQLGLHASESADITNLKNLLDDARPFDALY